VVALTEAIINSRITVPTKVKCTKHPRHADLFTLNPRYENSRSKKKFIEPKCSTSRYYKSAVPFHTRLLNKVEKQRNVLIVNTEVEEEQDILQHQFLLYTVLPPEINLTI
jgi:hypothetical protein